ncbi:MAG: hypothetical protein K2Q18_13960, partial [Bdellovibrionales bacterium]|nr:hypothetical protein [Bdellovibrionales bacterium]
ASHSEFCESMKIHCSNKNSPSLTIWEKGDTDEDAEIYGVIDYLTEAKLIKLVPTGRLITKITGSTKAGKQVLVKVPISEKVHYFTGGLLKFHPDDITYTLEIQQDIFKSQARSNFRLNASEIIPVQFKIDEQVFDSLDISASGTSFLIDRIDTERFAKGKTFPDCTLRFDRKNYHIPYAYVATQLPYLNEAGKPTERLKIGIAFKDVPQKTEDELYIKISTEARGEEMKKKFDIILSKKAN